MTDTTFASLPAHERVEVLREYARRYNLSTFVETGTLTGDTPWGLRNDFGRLYTIEIDEDIWKRAIGRFTTAPQIIALLGDSTDVLPSVLDAIDGPALFWLDGHSSGPGTGRGVLDTPIVAELETIAGSPHQHVVLIDDARIFDGAPEHDLEPHYRDYPSIEWVAGFAADNGWDFELDRDIMRLTCS